MTLEVQRYSEPFADFCWLRLPKAFGKMNMIQVGDFVKMRLIIDVGLIFFRVSAQTVLDWHAWMSITSDRCVSVIRCHLVFFKSPIGGGHFIGLLISHWKDISHFWGSTLMADIMGKWSMSSLSITFATSRIWQASDPTNNTETCFVCHTKCVSYAYHCPSYLW